MKNFLSFLIAFFLFSPLLMAQSIEDQIQKSPYDLIKIMNQSEKQQINWSKLLYSAFFTRDIPLNKEDNFVQKSLFEKRELIIEARKFIFKDLLSLNIDHEITIKELLEINPSFQQSLTRKFFNPEILLPVAQAGYQLNIGSVVFLTGTENLIDLILKSGYFVDRLPLKPVESLYRPYAFNKLIIEARHLNLNPALFPKIYVQDKNGKLILVYSIAHANFNKITKQGYVRYYADVKNFDLNDKHTFYCAALNPKGTKSTDLIISYEDYIKFFASALSYQNLSEGNLVIITNP